MTESAQPPLRIVVFGDIAAGLWGAAIGSTEPLFVAGVENDELSGSATLEVADELGEWRLTSTAASLTITAAADPVHLSADQPLDGVDQLCRVEGQIATGPVQRTFDCLGRRALRHLPSSRELDSVRDVSAWFEPDQGMALTAVRKRKARGHERDLTVAAILDAGAVTEVADPRLSTTYDEDGAPARMSLELWLDEQEGEQQYPRRAAGEAAVPAATASGGKLELIARALVCHSRGNEGTGVYLLVRRR